MIRVRVLSVLMLVVSIFSVHYGMVNFDNNPNNPWSFWYVSMMLFGGVSTVSSTMILLLTFFALSSEHDGSYVIDRDTLYGRVFVFISFFDQRIDGGDWCSTFLFMNLGVSLFSLLVGVVVFVLTVAGVTIYENALGVLMVVAIGLSVVAGVLYVYRKIYAQFEFTQLSAMYRRYLCPRLRVKH